MMTKLLDKVNILSVMEYNEAAKNYGRLFNSMHEGFAVLMEEVEEAAQDMIRLEDSRMEALWCAVKTDSHRQAEIAAAGVEKLALHLACEAIQVAAMARKMLKTIEPK